MVAKKNQKMESVTLIDNPLLADQRNELIISPSREIEEKVDMLTEIDNLTTLNKQVLAVKREKVQLEVDNKKLDTAKKTINTLEKIIDAVASADVIERVTENIKTPMDMKLMADAAERLSTTLKNLMGGSSMDEFGNKKKQKINFMFKSSGTVQGAIQIDNSDE